MTARVDAVIDHNKIVLREANNIRTEARPVPRVMSTWDDEEGSPRFEVHKNDEDIARGNTLIFSALAKFSPTRLPYVSQAQKVVDHAGLSNDYTREHLIGILKALLFEYENGSLKSIEELVHADLFSDFLAMARHILDSGFKDPAAVIAA
jgi:hypothetical protein